MERASSPACQKVEGKKDQGKKHPGPWVSRSADGFPYANTQALWVKSLIPQDQTSSTGSRLTQVKCFGAASGVSGYRSNRWDGSKQGMLCCPLTPASTESQNHRITE